MTLKSNTLLAIGLVVSFASNADNASINASLQSVCQTSAKAAKAQTNESSDSAQKYQAKLAMFFSDSSCNGKQLIESYSDKMTLQNTKLEQTVMRTAD